MSYQAGDGTAVEPYQHEPYAAGLTPTIPLDLVQARPRNVASAARRKQQSLSSVASSSSSLSSRSPIAVGHSTTFAARSLLGPADLLNSGPGNKCGKCQNHELERSKKGHARDCPFKKCDCLKCRLLDARSDILQVISGKETKLKGTKKDPNCGFCQNHGVKILRKGHVRSCGFGQERHFRLDNCFSCEVHYIRNEVNRLQIKMRRAMKEDRTLSEEQRKTAREAITRDEVEKVCEMARLARRKRGALVPAHQAGGESSTSNVAHWAAHCSYSPSPSASFVLVKEERRTPTFSGDAMTTTPLGVGPLRVQKCRRARQQLVKRQQQPYDHQQVAASASVWRPWSQQHQQQIVAAIAAQQQQQQQSIQQQQQRQVHFPLPHQHPCSQQQFMMHQHQEQQQQQLGTATMGGQSAQINPGMFARGMPNTSNNRATSAMADSGNQISRLLSQQNLNQQHLRTISNFNSPLVAQPQQQQQQPQQYQPVNLQCDNSQLAGRGGGGPLALPPPPPPPLNSRSQTPHQTGTHAGPFGGLFNSAAAMLQSNMLLNSALHHHHQQQQQHYEHKTLVHVTSQSRAESPLEPQLDILGSPEPPTYFSGERSDQHSRSPSVRSLSPVTDAANMSIHITCAPITHVNMANQANQVQMAEDQPPPLIQRAAQEQQVFNTLFRLLVAQFSQQNRRPQ